MRERERENGKRGWLVIITIATLYGDPVLYLALSSLHI